jgi:hypothetical protein
MRTMLSFGMSTPFGCAGVLVAASGHDGGVDTFDIVHVGDVGLNELTAFGNALILALPGFNGPVKLLFDSRRHMCADLLDHFITGAIGQSLVGHCDNRFNRLVLDAAIGGALAGTVQSYKSFEEVLIG